MSYLLSIIIPTKNRYQYLKECVLSLAELDKEKVEIIVHDNSDDNSEFLSFINAQKLSNLKYYHKDGALSQTDNSNYAVGHATGEYCCFIGDDDTAASAIVTATEYLKENDLLACVCDVATYYWNDVVFEGSKRPPLSFNESEVYVQRLKSGEIIKEVLSWGLQDIKYLARIYHGIIRTDILTKVREKTGTYFPGPSPDMANAISCTSLITDYVYVRAPLVISGYSYKSAGGMGLRGAHKGRLKDSKQLPANVEDDWDEQIPKLWLGYTMWPQSGITALRALGREGDIKRMNYNAMYAKTYLRYAEYREEVMRFVKSYGGVFAFGYELIRFGCRWICERIEVKWRKLRKEQYVNWTQISLVEAKHIVDSKYKNVEFK